MVETWLKDDPNNKKCELRNYKSIERNRTGRRGGGIKIYVKESISFQEITINPYNGSKLEEIYIAIASEEDLNIFACYNPKGEMSTKEWDHYQKQFKTNTLVLGDLNAHHKSWDSLSVPNQSGNTIKKFLEDEDEYHLLTPPDLGTRIDKTTGRFSTIDLAIGSTIYANLEVQKQAELISDHIPLILETKNKYIDNEGRREKWKFDNKEWPKYKDLLDKSPEATNFEEIQKQLKEIGQECFKLTQGNKNYHQTKPWWDEKCSKIIKDKHKAFNRYCRTKDIKDLITYKRLSAQSKHIIKRAQKTSFERYCNTLDFNIPRSKVWRFIKKMQGKYTSNSFPLTKNGTLIKTDSEKAN